MHSEIHVMAYSFQVPADSVLYNATFLHYEIFNRSIDVYHDVLFSQFVDADIGCRYNDRIGCDTSLNSFFAYNDPATVDSGSVCDVNISGYGHQKIAQGITFLNRKLSAFAQVSFSGAH